MTRDEFRNLLVQNVEALDQKVKDAEARVKDLFEAAEEAKQWDQAISDLFMEGMNLTQYGITHAKKWATRAQELLAMEKPDERNVN